jgi:hypothetical protein
MISQGKGGEQELLKSEFNTYQLHLMTWEIHNRIFKARWRTRTNWAPNNLT